MENSKKIRPDPKLRLMDQVRKVLRYHHYAYRTEQTYCDWITRYIRYHGGKTHPRDMGKKEIEAFLYSSGLRLMECIRLRVRDLDFERKLIYVRAAKGGRKSG